MICAGTTGSGASLTSSMSPRGSPLRRVTLPLHHFALCSCISSREKERGEQGERAQEKEKERRDEVWGCKSQLDRGIWQELTYCKPEMKAQSAGLAACSLKGWHDSHKENTFLTPPQKRSHKRAI